MTSFGSLRDAMHPVLMELARLPNDLRNTSLERVLIWSSEWSGWTFLRLNWTMARRFLANL